MFRRADAGRGKRNQAFGELDFWMSPTQRAWNPPRWGSRLSAKSGTHSGHSVRDGSARSSSLTFAFCIFSKLGCLSSSCGLSAWGVYRLTSCLAIWGYMQLPLLHRRPFQPEGKIDAIAVASCG
ncbi:hypothetical protein K402DRAFT_191841 [Aulographum hederae CBS 113979]|uniref:Uncharacterized protein n=1 Tax=Aulographum hederae CBS 113979 TaxID=1176131 RepID=A0A6G1GNZ7_9PEZI|nr:hypothetical protein K402DRAFT_191841 [Aulographum hederae CBS 113979]